MNAWNELADSMLAADGPAALVCRQWLMPAEGRDAVIFPPTFAAPEGGKAGYNIDEIHDRNDPNRVIRVAIIDTVGSQANRMEPLFKRENGRDTDYSRLVPQIEIRAGNKTVNLLDAGHRAADAIVRFSTLGPKLQQAFDAYQETGDASELAKIAPTSIVFGAWDSRGTQAKLPRLVASTIRAYDVDELSRSAQYNPPIDYIGLELIEAADSKSLLDAASELGFRHAPAAGTHGGIIVHGEIRREAILSLVGLRALGPQGPNGDPLRRYILGLALVAMIHNREHNLRQGCLLVADPEKETVWELVAHDGSRTPFNPDSNAALAFAREAAERFVVGEDATVDFDVKEANKALQEKVQQKTNSGRGRSKRGG
ncbi:MAG: type I-U CRISPR-associated protein Cas7 [Acidobacteriia bacterium]|nr:type I-U CRISPR-associated protein Cas7 [Methyloceanibacter sp.]MCL6492780.1 type I-U CRISPR-associated protein Cas7 [Terriglobia bacterium]